MADDFCSTCLCPPSPSPLFLRFVFFSLFSRCFLLRFRPGPVPYSLPPLSDFSRYSSRSEPNSSSLSSFFRFRGLPGLFSFCFLGPRFRFFTPNAEGSSRISSLSGGGGGGSGGGGGGGEGEGEGEGGCDGSDPGVGLRARTPLPLARPRADAAPRAGLAQRPLPPLPLPGQSRTRPALAALTRPGSAPDGPAAVRRRGRVGSGKKALKNRISR